MNYDNWIGKSKNLSDTIAPEPLRRFEALLDRDPGSVNNGTILPPCAHWIYFNPAVPQAVLAADGHPQKGDFLPPVELPSRMWAGGIIRFKKPLKTGQPADKKTTITAIDEKEGGSGKLCFITLRHQISTAGALAIDEDQEIVFREASEKGAHPIRTQPVDVDFDWKKSVQLNSAHLFRFSALTFNSHKIHYDHPYATQTEGYPNLVVHAPLLLVLMMNFFKTKTDGKVIEEIAYRAAGPMFLHEEITITSKDTDNNKVEMRALGPDQNIALKASINWTYSW